MVFVFILVLQGQIQVIYQIEEVGVVVGCQVVGVFGYKVIGLGRGIVVEFWEYIGSGFYVVQGVKVMIVIEGVVVFQFYVGECQMGFLVGVVFGFVIGEFRFLMVIVGQVVVNLCFVFNIEMYVGLIVIFVVIVVEIVYGFDFVVYIQFVCVFIINFCCLCCC